jgi:dihydropyrimidinase
MIQGGYTTFKIFMTYPPLHVDDGNLLDVLRIVTGNGGRLSVHAENYYISDNLIREFHKLGLFAPRWHPRSRPWQSEYEATVRAMALAQVAEAELYIVHMSSRHAVHALAKARREGRPVIGETVVHYLAFTEEVYDQPDFEGAKYVCSPPIRAAQDQDALWAALQNGDLQVVGSDHDAFTMAERRRLGEHDFASIPNGVGGVEQIRPILWSLGYRKNRLSLERFVAVTATNPARAFGLWPRKGAIAPGADADIVLWDPNRTVRLGLDTTHSACDYCLYEGYHVIGYPVTVLSRGEFVMENGEITARPGRGRFLRRGRPLLV